MKTWLCTTLTNLYSPLQGIARLYAYCKKQGVSVEYKDFNQDAFFSLLSDSFLFLCFEKISSMLYTLERNNSIRECFSSLLLASSNNYLVDLIHSGSVDPLAVGCPKPIYHSHRSALVHELLENRQSVVSAISCASKTLDKSFFSLPPHTFLKNYATLMCGKAIYDAVHFPMMLDFGFGFFGTHYGLNAAEICKAVHDEKHNFLIPYFKSVVLPQVQSDQPEVIGLSVTHISDMIPALTLANIVKSKFKEVHICLGGATITEIAYRIRKNPCLWEYFDSIILGPGEESFVSLVEHLDAKRPLSSVPNAIFKKNGTLVQSQCSHQFDLNNACCPQYPSARPGAMLSLETSSGCYWGKCIFCYYPQMGRNDISEKKMQMKERKLELVIEDLKQIKKQHNPLCIGITDSSLHPERLWDILSANAQQELGLKFSAFIRFEKEFTSKAFCKKIANLGFLGGQAGLESGSNRTNQIINKGITVEDARSILKNCSENGILLHLYSMVGIPGETREDAQMTFDFIAQLNQDILLDWQIYPFTLLENSPLPDQAPKYGLRPIPAPDDFLAQFMSYTVDGCSLSQQQSFQLALRFSEQLRKHTHPLSGIMDVEAYKIFLLIQRAKGLSYDKGFYAPLNPRL